MLASPQAPAAGSSDQLPLSLTAVVVAVDAIPVSLQPGRVETSRHAFPTRRRKSSAAKPELPVPPGRSYIVMGRGGQCTLFRETACEHGSVDRVPNDRKSITTTRLVSPP